MAGNKEGEGDGGKCDGNEGDGNVDNVDNGDSIKGGG